MFYKYSDYPLEKIKSEEYEELCKELLSMAKDDKIKEKMEAILYDGGYGDFSVITGLTKNDEFIERKRRIGYAYLLVTNPETFDTLTKNGINLFHGTNANALPNILRYGMKSVDEQSINGITTTTGEEYTRVGGKRDFISFSDDIDTALEYASTQKTFGVLIGISSGDLRKMKTCRSYSDLPEVRIMNSIPLEYIKTIAVPEDKVEFVRKLVGNNEIIVTPILTDEKFYYIDIETGEVNFDAEKATQLKKQITRTNFDSKQIAEMSQTRKVSGIRNIYEKIKGTITNKGRENGKDTRDK